MSNLVQFPGRPPREWRLTAQTIRETLAEQGFIPESIDWIVRDIKPRADAMESRLSISLAVPEANQAAVTSAIDQVIQVVHDTASRALWQMVGLEIELYVARFGGIDKPPSH
jgi:hypothetical protein